MNARSWRSAWLMLLACVVLAVQMAPVAQTSRPLVYVVKIEGVIDLGLAPFVKRALQEAEDAGAAALVLDINTFGGRVDAAVQIRDSLLNSKVRSIAFVNKRAISAGALISLAANQIVMGGGGTIGAATPVQMGGPGGGALPTEEKTVSYVRKEFRATAESRGRLPLLAEAMVDASVAVPGLVEKGKLLTLTTDEALQHKLADFRADTLESALRQAGLADAQTRPLTPNWAENVVRFLTHPVVSSLLMSIAILGILIELRTPGFGLPGAAGVGSLGLFLWGHWLVQLAGWEEMLLAAAGIVLLLLEFLVIPGFGIAGGLGIFALLAALLLSMIGPGNTAQLVLLVASRVVFSLLLAIALSFALLRFMTRLPIGRKLVLQTGLGSAQGYASGPPQDAGLLGKRGHARSVLRPAGIADIDGRRVDVVSDGELIESGGVVEVVQVDGNRVVVKRVPDDEPGST
jgi:membrane-bound serine protease (ClpP class)